MKKDIGEQSFRRHISTTTENSPLSSGAGELRGFQPPYVRLPRPGARCPWTGLSRGTMNELILGPDAPVRSLVITRPGAHRGIRLIEFASLLQYLDGLLVEQAGANQPGEEVDGDE
jgi:hypothetical protein